MKMSSICKGMDLRLCIYECAYDEGLWTWRNDDVYWCIVVVLDGLIMINESSELKFWLGGIVHVGRKF